MHRRTLFGTTSLSTVLVGAGLALLPLTMTSSAYAFSCTPATPQSGTPGNLTTLTCTGAGGPGIGAIGSSNANYISASFDSTVSGSGTLSIGTGNVLRFDGADTITGSPTGTNSTSSGVVIYGNNNTVTINGSIKTPANAIQTTTSTRTTGTVITVNSAGNLTSSATDKATVYVYGDANITNYGTIANTGGAAAIRVGAGSVLTNYGTITGKVRLASPSATPDSTDPDTSVGNVTLAIATGSSINGVVQAQGQNNTLSLIGTGSSSLNVGSIGSYGSGQNYQGFDTFVKDGTGTWTLTGTNTGMGTTTVKAGTVVWNATTPNAPISVLAGALVQGTGTVGSIDNQGTVAPGNSPGTLTVTGNYTQRSNGTLQVVITPTAASKLAIGGKATLDGTLAVLPQTGTYTAGTSYQIVTAQSVSGTFKAIQVSNPSVLGGLAVGASYLGNEVDLQLMSSQAASTQQQQQSVKEVVPEVTRQAAELQTTLIGNHIANILFPPDFARALKKKTAAQSADSGLAGGDDSLQGLSAWGDASLAWLDNTDSANKYDGLHKAATLGADYRFTDHLIAGAAFTPTEANTNLRSVDGNRDATAISGSAYAGYKFDDIYAVQAIAGYGRAFNTSNQKVAGVNVKNDYDTDRFLAQIGASAAYLLQDDLRLIPSLTYTQAIESPSSGHSSDGAAVKVPGVRLGTVKAGAQVDYAVTAQFVPFLTGGVERDLINSAGSSGRQGYSLGGGIQAPLDDNLTLGVAATTNFGRAAQSETQVSANVRYAW